MAGSYLHVINENRELEWGLIDNLGDACETIQEMHYMIEFLSNGDGNAINKARRYAMSKLRSITNE